VISLATILYSELVSFISSEYGETVAVLNYIFETIYESVIINKHMKMILGRNAVP
jgi:hypothetical protein